MGKFYGLIGYVTTSETEPGVWTEIPTTHNYCGDIMSESRSWKTGESINDDLTINNRISIVADPYAYENFHTMKYINWMGTNWKIIKIDVQRPRLVLTIGGVYNGVAGPTT